VTVWGAERNQATRPLGEHGIGMASQRLPLLLCGAAPGAIMREASDRADVMDPFCVAHLQGYNGATIPICLHLGFAIAALLRP
jgi:hypothetical protein